MRWDLAGSSLGDSPKESGSSLGTRREITRKKTGGLSARLPEVTRVCGKAKASSARCSTSGRVYTYRQRSKALSLVLRPSEDVDNNMAEYLLQALLQMEI
ncbi:hypothetical protein B296_00015115 [Ensete ventricosum]|uniref:Uncharacterized protein n=1 Tax=Ensete ventricosum TaxID=4639 RepID=A0A426Y315_ENSVE|nr:hypothetical protein B296_00015115 [Ensete ventricosum]